MSNLHTFHIPVMGTGFTSDTPSKVAHYGISSVISLVDDTLLEDLREFHCQKRNLPFTAITKYESDFRARRITAYLNLMNYVVSENFENAKHSPFTSDSEITKYFEMLPETSPAKQLYLKMLAEDNGVIKNQLQDDLRRLMKAGDINVNIMTKLDRPNFDSKDNPLPSEFSDALAALRGYALSDLTSSIVFSAGINRRLYSYIAEFKDFFPNEKGYLKKKVVLKVSDYRSALIQGQFLAKKGIWVSEFRVESGLNCGGHAFATDGYLMGPILEEFKKHRESLRADLFKVCNAALQDKGYIIFDNAPEMRVTAQGGIGTAREHDYLIKYYQLDSAGWGTPFLLVPEATNVEDDTLQKLAKATEDDLYLSDVSPLGVPFNNLKGSPSDIEKMNRFLKNRPGSACPKGHLVSNTEFTILPICTASRQYQKLKINQLTSMNLDPAILQERIENVVKKACLCNELGDGALILNKIKMHLKRFPAVCPGPNLAYFSKIVSLKEMVDHIYGRCNILNATPRPHMFVKELKLYIDYLIKEIQKLGSDISEKDKKYWSEFRNNLLQGIEYYMKFFPQMMEESQEFRQKALLEIHAFRKRLVEFAEQYRNIFHPQIVAA